MKKINIKTKKKSNNKAKIKVKRPENISKEMQALCDAINGLLMKYNGDISFVGSFVGFNENCDVVEDRLFCYGLKDVLKDQIYSLAEEIVKEKDDFVNI